MFKMENFKKKVVKLVLSQTCRKHFNNAIVSVLDLGRLLLKYFEQGNDMEWYFRNIN